MGYVSNRQAISLHSTSNCVYNLLRCQHQHKPYETYVDIGLIWLVLAAVCLNFRRLQIHNEFMGLLFFFNRSHLDLNISSFFFL